MIKDPLSVDPSYNSNQFLDNHDDATALMRKLENSDTNDEHHYTVERFTPDSYAVVCYNECGVPIRTY